MNRLGLLAALTHLLFLEARAIAAVSIPAPCVLQHVGNESPPADAVLSRERPMVARSDVASTSGCSPLGYNPLDKGGFPFAGERDRIRVTFTGDDGALLKLRDAGIQANTVPFQIRAAGDEKPTPVMVYEQDLDKTEFQIRLVELGEVGHGTVVEVDITLGTQTKIWYFRMSNRFSFYGIGGAWLPLALFSTNFTSDEHGLSLNALPVGIAWGGRVYVAEDIYIGGSVFANWLIHPDVDQNGNPNGNYHFSSFAFGPLIDIDKIGRASCRERV